MNHKLEPHMPCESVALENRNVMRDARISTGGATSSQVSIDTNRSNAAARLSMHLFYDAFVSAAVCRRDS